MWWNKIREWFSNLSERRKCISDFNNAASDAFIRNTVPVYMKAEISFGNKNYKHIMSNLLFSGFRIKTISGRFLTNDEVEYVGIVIVSNQELMRKLVTLGFDTLEIYSPSGGKVKDWRLTSIMQIGQ